MEMVIIRASMGCKHHDQRLHIGNLITFTCLSLKKCWEGWGSKILNKKSCLQLMFPMSVESVVWSYVILHSGNIKKQELFLAWDTPGTIKHLASNFCQKPPKQRLNCFWCISQNIFWPKILLESKFLSLVAQKEPHVLFREYVEVLSCKCGI